MKVQEIKWSNYRNLPDGRLAVRDHLVLIGPNDTGKSSLVRAMHLCLGMAHSQVSAAITLRDFADPALPLVLTVTLGDLDNEDRAAFPDEITIGPPEALVIELEASLDPVDPDQKAVKRYFPDSGHIRGPTKDQVRAIGFEFVPAVRSLLRELGGSSSGAVRSLLSSLDLSGDVPALTQAADAYRAALDGAEALRQFRGELANSLTNALPNPVSEDDVRVVSEAEILEDPLSGVTVTVRDGQHDVPLAEQSDGVRAMSVLTLLSMSHKGARILAVDEPETHLHPTAQRAVAIALHDSTAQVVVVTHSPFVASAFDPMDIVTLRPDRGVHQLPPDAAIGNGNITVRHWSSRLIEPLTARHVLLVEGVSDRVLVERVAELTALDMHRCGIAVFELDGSGQFGTAYGLFGQRGFNLHVVGLLDEDARNEWAREVAVPAIDLEAAGFIVCDPDLEAIYIDALGVDVVLAMILASPSIARRSLLDSCGVADVGDIDRDMLWRFCRKKKNKVSVALAVGAAIDAAQAQALAPLVNVLALVR